MLRIDRALTERLRDHAATMYPLECCGALIGRANGSGREVVDVVPIDNRRGGDAARRRFLVTAEDYRRIEMEARARKLDLLGFYHSHPDHPAQPSDYDRDHALPWFSYLIVSVEAGTPGDIRCWTLRDDRLSFEREEIKCP